MHNKQQKKKQVMRKYIAVFGLAFICACNYSTDKKAAVSIKDTVAVKTTAAALNTDTLFVDERAAVFVMPGNSRIAKRKKEIGEENFQIGADDYAFYLNEAGTFLDSVKMKTIDTKYEKFIKFIGAGNRNEIVAIDKLPELWSIYFFDPAKKARQIDMIAIEEEYKNYFTK